MGTRTDDAIDHISDVQAVASLEARAAVLGSRADGTPAASVAPRIASAFCLSCHFCRGGT